MTRNRLIVAIFIIAVISFLAAYCSYLPLEDQVPTETSIPVEETTVEETTVEETVPVDNEVTELPDSGGQKLFYEIP